MMSGAGRTDPAYKVLLAGIYAGDEVLDQFHCSEARAQLERDLNRLYLEYSLPRGELFQKTAVSASGDVKPVVFYAISLFILALCCQPSLFRAFSSPWILCCADSSSWPASVPFP